MSEEASLWALFAASFLAATLLPGGSEAVLYAVLRLNPGEYWIPLAVATAGNTLGGMSSWLIGRLLPRGKPQKGLAAVQKYGAPVLVFSWVPVIGDPLCVAAGWLRLDPWLSLAFIALGKAARYWIIAMVAA